jgi:HD-GYP domain-containing protein (c-di-GMP phosphodiesterase class II)
MKLCKIEDLKGKEILAKDIVTSDYQILLSSGNKLKKELIEKLPEYGIREVYIEDEKPDTRTVVILRDEVKEGFKSKVKDILEKHTYSHNEELMELSMTADKIIDNILENDNVVEKIYDIKERNSDVYEHSISICSLATLVALKMGLSHETVHDIGVSCLLHDIGLRYLTIDYENQDINALSKNELAEYKKHPVYGYSALRNENWISMESKNMILYHHERLDGTGYPLKATEIPQACRIVQVCDAFDEMICGIGCRRNKVYEAIEYLKAYSGKKFDSEVVDIFLKFTAVYPAGTKIMTNEGEIGVVLYQNNEFPSRPVIRITQDAKGNEVDVVKDLIKINNIYIEKVVE